MQEGTCGLILAVERYDPSRGASFASYAVWPIRGQILTALSNASMIRLPAELRRRVRAVDRVVGDLGALYGSRVSDASIVKRTGLNDAAVRRARTAPRVTISLDTPVGEEGTCLRDLIGDESEPDPAEQAGAADDARDVMRALHRLPSQQRNVLERRFGLDGRAAESYRQVGAHLGVGEDQARVIERQALRRLKSLLIARTPVAGS